MISSTIKGFDTKLNVSRRSLETLFTRYGGKGNIWHLYIDAICELSEKNQLKTFIDVFAGAGTMTLAAISTGCFDKYIINDLDIGMTSLISCIKDEEKCSRLVERLLSVRYNKKNFLAAHKILETLRAENIYEHLSSGDSVPVKYKDKVIDMMDQYNMRKKLEEKLTTEDIAFYQFIESSCSRNSDCKTFKNCEDIDLQESFYRKAERLLDKSYLLENVVIENMSFEDVFIKYWNEKALWFLDPPYVHETRSKGARAIYRYEMDWIQHKLMLNYLLDQDRKFMLCGYDENLIQDPEVREVYAKLLEYKNITKKDLGVVSRDATGKKNNDSEPSEIVWIGN